MLSSIHLPLLSKPHAPSLLRHDHQAFKLKTRHRLRFSVNAIETNSFEPNYTNNPQQTQPTQQKQMRTLFPGGFKRPEIKVPSIILQLSSEEVLRRDGVLEYVDVAISKWVQIVVLNGGNESGGKLYEAACLLKEVIRDRAYMVIAERVDIAAAVGASGVLLSDQGLPALVARNMMMESKSKSVILPLVARKVQSANAAISASDSEGADFLIYDVDEENYTEVLLSSVIQSIKVPVFITITLDGQDPSITEASKLLQAGASGLVISFDDMKISSDDRLSQLFPAGNLMSKRTRGEYPSSNNFDRDRGFHEKNRVSGFIKLEDKEKKFIETERMVLLEAISVVCRAAPLMEEVSLLTDAVSQLDDPFLLVIVGEFNSGKSSVINALLGQKYLKEGVVPTTNEITLLCYSEMNINGQERCERHPDGQYICYLPAPILKEMNLVDTPGTNVILQRQQRLTEEFVPRADLLLFVISADRPLTDSEVTFLRYIQQWKKKVVFVLNKSDLYQTTSELEEAVKFIKENVQKLLNTEHVTLYPVSARSAIEAKLSFNPVVEKDREELLVSDSRWRSSGFFELEKFLFSFLDGSTDTGLERMKLKLGTPIGISDRVIASCEDFVRKDFEIANQDLISVNEIVNGLTEYALKMKNENMSWRRQTLSLIDNAKSRAMRLVESSLQLSNLDLVASYVFKGEKTVLLPAASTLQNDIIDPAYSDLQVAFRCNSCFQTFGESHVKDPEKLLGEFSIWLQSNNVREGRLYKETFEKRWPSFGNQQDKMHLETYKLVAKGEDLSLKVLENFSGAAAAKLFEQEIREVILGTFGELGAAGLSASLLTSVLPTTLEDLLALGLCSAGGLIAISKFPTRRKEVAEKVQRTADALARELEEAMQKDLLQTIENLENFVKFISRPYQDAAQQSVDRSLKLQEELTSVGKKLRTLQLEIQNLHVS